MAGLINRRARSQYKSAGQRCINVNYSANEKLEIYGLAALSDNELLSILKFKKPIDEFYQSNLFKAAKELVRRRETPEVFKVSSSRQTREYFSFLEQESEEQFWVVFLRNNNTVIKSEMISKESSTGTVVDIAMIMRKAILNKAKNLILCHNHPSGNMTPSSNDRDLTVKLCKAAQLMDFTVIDHIIVAGNNYFSFADEGLIP